MRFGVIRRISFEKGQRSLPWDLFKASSPISQMGNDAITKRFVPKGKLSLSLSKTSVRSAVIMPDLETSFFRVRVRVRVTNFGSNGAMIIKPIYIA